MSFNIVEQPSNARKWPQDGVKLLHHTLSIGAKWEAEHWPNAKKPTFVNLMYDKDTDMFGFSVVSIHDYRNGITSTTISRNKGGITVFIGPKISEQMQKSGYTLGLEVIPYTNKDNPGIFVLPKM